MSIGLFFVVVALVLAILSVVVPAPTGYRPHFLAAAVVALAVAFLFGVAPVIH